MYCVCKEQWGVQESKGVTAPPGFHCCKTPTFKAFKEALKCLALSAHREECGVYKVCAHTMGQWGIMSHIEN